MTDRERSRPTEIMTEIAEEAAKETAIKAAEEYLGGGILVKILGAAGTIYNVLTAFPRDNSGEPSMIRERKREEQDRRFHSIHDPRSGLYPRDEPDYERIMKDKKEVARMLKSERDPLTGQYPENLEEFHRIKNNLIFPPEIITHSNKISRPLGRPPYNNPFAVPLNNPSALQILNKQLMRTPSPPFRGPTLNTTPQWINEAQRQLDRPPISGPPSALRILDQHLRRF
jgi:hypothetical protein